MQLKLVLFETLDIDIFECFNFRSNVEALLLCPIEVLIMEELKKIKNEYDLMIGRKATSATGFTVLAIVNKLLTLQSRDSKPKEALKESKTKENEEEEQKLIENDGGKESYGNEEEKKKLANNLENLSLKEGPETVILYVPFQIAAFIAGPDMGARRVIPPRQPILT
ncbi:hypothetical protein M9H77_02140 [Catharanthus roseus]|uniref:Uncharacterized protein n=1 Tax=Catharanthus roseus TaxID=4058 RepID=A0ACC0C7Z2_CATRO|nr:hypothetical protein M9H77_02140 [Catharanthus roseus]